EWGEAINYDGENSAPVREWVTTNAAYWADEYHLDGLRLDATQQIFDASEEHIIASIVKSFHGAARDRQTLIVAEDERQSVGWAMPQEKGGDGLAVLWNDDLPQGARVAEAGGNEAYYSDCQGRPQEFISAGRYGFLFQGQRSRWQSNPRGTPAGGMRAHQFV